MVTRKGITRKKGEHKGFDILIERDNGFLYYSVLTPGKVEIISGFREDTVSLSEYYRFLEKQVDEYRLHPHIFEEDSADVKK